MTFSENNVFATHRMLISRLFAFAIVACVILVKPPVIFAEWITGIGTLAGYVCLAVAAFGRLWCLMYIADKKNKVLLAEGPYSIVRNPLYVFSFIGAVGFGLAVENPWILIAIILWFLCFYPFTIVHEEKHLATLFGDQYLQYCTRTPRLVPNFRLYRESGTLTVDPVRIRNGILDAMWFLWAFLLWEALELCRASGLWTHWF